jgi:hypothetical protein
MAFALCFIALLANISAIERLYTVAHAVRLRELGQEQEEQAHESNAEPMLTQG